MNTQFYFKSLRKIHLILKKMLHLNRRYLLKYTLMTSVPRNWIPFIPVHTNDVTTLPSNPLRKHIQLQRATVIDPIDKTSIGPYSRLLSEVKPHYYIDEAEVPRNGIIVSENCSGLYGTLEKFSFGLDEKKFMVQAKALVD